jgi:hypothetical protein
LILHPLIVEAFIDDQSYSFWDYAYSLVADMIVKFWYADWRVGATFAKYSFSGNVVVCHYDWVHAAEVYFTDVIVRSNFGFKDKSPSVGDEEFLG